MENNLLSGFVMPGKLEDIPIHRGISDDPKFAEAFTLKWKAQHLSDEINADNLEHGITRKTKCIVITETELIALIL
jgi:hypothetical protein